MNHDTCYIPVRGTYVFIRIFYWYDVLVLLPDTYQVPGMKHDTAAIHQYAGTTSTRTRLVSAIKREQTVKKQRCTAVGVDPSRRRFREHAFVP